MSHLRLRLLTAAAALIALATLGASLGAAPAAASVNGVVISEFRVRGSAGGNDEFVELRNAGSAPVNISGWRLEGCAAASGAASLRVAVGAGVVLAPGQSYLFANNGIAGYTGAVTPDQNYSTGFTDFLTTNASGIRITDAGSVVIDGVGSPTSPCREGVGFTTSATNSGTLSFERLLAGTQDNDNNLTDFEGPKAGDPQNFGDAAPTVASSVPANNDTGVALGANLAVTFSEPVNVTDPWFTLVCTVSGTKTATATGGPTTFSIDPATDFAPGESCTLTVLASGVKDQDGVDPPDNMAADFTAGYTTSAGDPCLQTFTPIPSIQGSGSSAAITGAVTTRGVVVGDYEGASPALRGFYIQAETGDGSDTTSDAIFVFNGGNQNVVALGDVVRVSGTAGENQDQTQISTSITGIVKCGTGTVAPTDVTLPAADSTALERYEGMLVRMPQTLSVTEHFQLGRFGQVTLSSNGRIYQPTALVPPGAPAIALQASNNLNRIILDDSSQFQNPDPIVWGRDGNPLSASNTLRGGDTVTGAVGVMTYTWAGNAASGNAFRLRPINALGGSATFVAANPRPAGPPSVGGSLRVVGMNLLNLFNTFGVGACRGGVTGIPVDCRGADDAGEFARQWPKTVAAAIGTGGDILGIAEIENDGYGPDSAIQFLVDKLNEATAPGTYAFIDADARSGQIDALGSDAIKVGVIYKPAKVTPIGTTAALNSVLFQNGGDGAPRNRPTLAQAFRQNDTGATLVVSPNHLKSKGSACDAPDTGDGQANCAIVRTNAANALADWLNGNPTGTGSQNTLIVGDLNSYAKENPIAALEAKGFTNLVAAKSGPEAYSYVFDNQWGYLDYAMGNASITSAVTGVGEWHINSDEPSVLDYNDDFKSPGQILSLYAPNEIRVSDHDPIVVGLNLNAPPMVSSGGPWSVNEGGSATLTATGTDDAAGLVYDWDLDNNGSYETAGQSVTFSAATIDGPASRTVGVRVTDTGGLTAVATTTVTIVNVEPTATLVAPESAFAGFAFTLALTNADDAAPADEPTLTYAFDCGSGYGAFTSSSTATCSSLVVGPLSVGGKVKDDDGGVTEYRDTVAVVVTFASLCELTKTYVANEGIANALCAKLQTAAAADARGKDEELHNYVNQVRAQSGKALTAEHAATLIALAGHL